MFKHSFWILMLGLLGCASQPVHEGLDKVRAGMDKDEVLNLAGNPKHTFHAQSQDHWIFRFYEGEQEMSREVIFQEGHVVSIGTLHPRLANENKSDDADDFEQLEKTLRDEQKQHQGQFQDVPGQ